MSGGYSFIESAAVMIGSDVFEVLGGETHSYFLNGVKDAGLPAVLASEFTVEETSTETKRSFDVVIDREKTEKIVIEVFKDFVSVIFSDATPVNFANSGGLMGDYLTGDFVGRDGQIIKAEGQMKHKIMNENVSIFVEDWQVRPGEDPLLFSTPGSVEYPEKCIMPKWHSGQAQTRRRLGGMSDKDAHHACSGSPSEDFEMCVFDVVATNDIEMAKVYVGAR